MSQKQVKIDPELLPEPEMLERFAEMLLFRGIKTTDTLISNRALSHWKKEGLLPLHAEERRWIRLNLTEYIWLKMVEDLRLIGVSFITIRMVKEHLFRQTASMKSHLDTTEKLTASRNLVHEKLGWDEDKIDNGLDMLQSEKVLNLAIKGHLLTQLSTLIMAAAFLNKKTGVYIPYDGIPLLYFDSDAERTNPNPRLEHPYIFLPVRHYLTKIWEAPSMEDKLTRLQLLNDDEMMVLRAVRYGDFKEIIIKPERDEDDKRKLKVTTITDGELTPEKQRQITEILGLKKYQSITLKKRSNTQIYFERKHTK